MSYPRKHRWFRGIAFGLAIASVVVAGSASAMIDPGTHGSQHVKAGGWSGNVDLESGIPLSAGIPHGDEQFIDEQTVEVIPYLSHGILSQAQANATAAQSDDDPYLTDVNVRPGESLGGPDGGPVVPRSARVSDGTNRVEAEARKDDEQTQRVWTDRD